MQSLLDPGRSYIKSEKNVIQYLKKIPDEEIKVFYENVELTPFPILLAKEYHKRFSKKELRSKNIRNKSKNFKYIPANKKIKRTKGKNSEEIHFRYGKGVKISKLKKR